MTSELPPHRAAAQRFAEVFGGGEPPSHVVRAPGRVNLLGEHTDYSGGFVLPVAIDREVAIAGRPRPDGLVRLFSIEYGEQVEFPLARIEPDPAHPWSNYLRGTLHMLLLGGYPVPGMDAVVAGNVPQGAGLSSSAALEVAAAVFAQAAGGFDLPPREAIRLARKAENDFVGVQCGIMDQFVSRLGRSRHALFLDTLIHDYDHVPLPAERAAVVVADTGVRRSLVSSQYNRRRQELEEGTAWLLARLPGAASLRDVTVETVRRWEGEMPGVPYRRCRHVVEENLRVLEGVKALRHGDLVRFGQLMNESHASLRDLYEVSCPELDAMAAIAQTVEGVYGSRMTGAGFGGCTVSLVHPSAVERLIQALQAEYPRQTGRQATVYVFTAADGAGPVGMGVA